MKKNDLKILRFPNSVSNLERQVEAILFAAEEPLDIESIKEKLNARSDIKKILNSFILISLIYPSYSKIESSSHS